MSEALSNWVKHKNIELKFIEKGKPFQNGYMERFNRSYREDVLNAYCFTRLKQAQVLSNAWMWIYNNLKPHKSLNYKSPMDFLYQYLKRVTS